MKTLFLLTLLCMGLIGCAPHSAAPLSQVRLNLKHEPPTLDPRKGGDIISSQLQFLLFEGLVRLNADHTLSLAQAKSVEVSADGLTYTFKLRGTSWSNGMPVTAQDFEKAWKDSLNPHFPSPNAFLFYPIKNAAKAKEGILAIDEIGVTALDALTLEVRLEKPIPYLLELLSFCSFFPICSAIEAQDLKWAHEAGPHFVTNGPFALKEWKHHNELIAVKNSHYWNAAMPRPDRLHFSMIGDEMTALHLFEQGSLDMIGEPFCPLPLEAIASLKVSGSLKTHPIGATTFVTFNLEQVPFNNKKIRKAFSLAINREALIQNILNTGELPAWSIIPPVLTQDTHDAFFHDNDKVSAQILLKEGLEELGLTKETLPRLTYSYFQSDRHHQIAQALQQQWKQVLDLDVHLETMEFKILMDKLCKKDYLFGQSMWAAQYHDPMNIFERFYSKSQTKNYPGWENPLYQNFIDASFYACSEKRAELLLQAEALFLDEMPLAPLYHWNMTYITQPSLSPEVTEHVFNLLPHPPQRPCAP